MTDVVRQNCSPTVITDRRAGPQGPPGPAGAGIDPDVEDALQGTSGSPSDSNRFVTDSDSRLTNSRTPTGVAAGALIAGTYPNALAPTNAFYTGLRAALADRSQLNGASQLVSTDSNGKIPAGNLPNSVMEYQGTWDASTNTPTLVDGTGNVGDVRRVTVAGTQDLGGGPITFRVGDYAIYNGARWELSAAAEGVNSVFGRMGDITAQSGDYSLEQIDGLVDALAAKMDKDGPWQPLTPASDCLDVNDAAPGLAPPLRYRRNGDTIRLSGMIACTAPDPGKVLAVLDEDDWPEYPVAIGVAADNDGYITTFMQVSTTGEISTVDPVTALPLSHITFELT